MKYRVTAPMGITLPAGTVLLNLTPGQLDRLGPHLAPGKGPAKRELAAAAAFKRGEEIELQERLGKAHLHLLEAIEEPKKAPTPPPKAPPPKDPPKDPAPGA